TIHHGEAVGLDMLISTAIAFQKGLCSKETLQRLRRLLLAAKLPVKHSVCEPQLLMRALERARTHRSGDLNLVVPREIGNADFVEQVSVGEMEAALKLVGMETCENGRSPRGSWRNASAIRVVA